MNAPFPSFTKVWHTDSYAAISPSRHELSAKGKTILITGGGSGIGAAIAKSFASAGAFKIALVGRRAALLRSTQEALQLSFPNLIVVVCVADIRDENAMSKSFHSLGDTKIDIFVSNAGLGAVSSIKETTVSSWWEMVEINMKGAFVVTKAFLKIAASNAVIINVTSNISHFGFAPNVSAYAASKAGAVRFFDALQQEYPDMTVINMQPGIVDTPMSRKGGFPALDNISLPSDFVLWLASPEGAFLKGKYVWANWDVEEMIAKKEDIVNSGLLTIQLGGWPFKSPGH